MYLNEIDTLLINETLNINSILSNYKYLYGTFFHETYYFILIEKELKAQLELRLIPNERNSKIEDYLIDIYIINLPDNKRSCLNLAFINILNSRLINNLIKLNEFKGEEFVEKLSTFFMFLNNQPNSNLKLVLNGQNI
ncbi:MAG: hypothetical protein ABI851_00440 [Saprospiraceae bacterium]